MQKVKPKSKCGIKELGFKPNGHNHDLLRIQSINTPLLERSFPPAELEYKCANFG